MNSGSVPPAPPELARDPGRGFWSGSLGYPHAVLLCCGWVCAGFAVEGWLGDKSLIAPAWPINAWMMGGFALWIAVLGAGYREHPWVLWLGGIPVALSSLATLFVLGGIAGVLQQGEQAPAWAKVCGLDRVIGGVPFALAMLLLLLNLGLALVRRVVTRGWQGWFFAANHLGLWLAIGCGFFGAGDMMRLRIVVAEGDASSVGVNEMGAPFRMPFTVVLRDFQMEEYPPTLTMVNDEATEIIWKKGEPILELLSGHERLIRGCRVRVLEHLSSGLPQGEAVDAPFIAAQGGVPAALIEIEASGGQKQQGWITRGSSSGVATRTLVCGGVRFAVAPARAKKFSSDLTVLVAGSEPWGARVEVNKPVSVLGWRLYQLGYDEAAGPASKWSLIEAVHDAWLPGVYAGFGLMLFGAIAMLCRRPPFSLNQEGKR